MCATDSVTNSIPQHNPPTEPFCIHMTDDAGNITSVPMRPIYVRNGLVIHRDPDYAHLYSVSHLHTGLRIVEELRALQTAYDFLQALDKVADFASIKAASPTLTKHQKWLIGAIVVQSRRCAYEGWYVGLDHWVGDYDWRTDAAHRTADAGGEGGDNG